MKYETKLIAWDQIIDQFGRNRLIIFQRKYEILWDWIHFKKTYKFAIPPLSLKFQHSVVTQDSQLIPWR